MTHLSQTFRRLRFALALLRGDYTLLAEHYADIVSSLVEATITSKTRRKEAAAARMSAYYGVVATPNPFILTWKNRMDGRCYVSTDGNDETFEELKSLDINL